MKRLILVACVAGCFVLQLSMALAQDVKLPISGLGLQTKTTVKASKSFTIACVVKNSTNPYMVSQLEGFKAAGKAMGVQTIAMAPAKQDNIEEQVKIIEDLLQRKVNGVAIHPSDSNGIVPVVEKAAAAGVPVVIIGTPANSEKPILRTGVDYKQSGVDIGEAVAKRMNGKGNLVIIEGPPQAANARERLQGINEALAKYPNIKVVASQAGHFRRMDSMQVMENLLQRFPKIDAVIGSNDESALGAVTALEAANRAKGVIVGGFDGNEDASHAIKAGRMTITWNADPYSSAWCAAAYMVMNLNNGALPPKKFIPYPSSDQSVLIAKENIDDYIKSSAWWKK
jgi:ABC-type sugar transport system substrate-binding protein